MRIHRHVILGLSVLVLGLGAAAVLGPAAQEAGATAGTAPDFRKIALQIVQDSVQVKEQEGVVIMGDPAKVPLMEAIAVEVARKGGFPHMVLSSPAADKRILNEAPLSYLQTPNRLVLAEFKKADVFIGLSPVQDPANLAQVPEERVALVRKASQAITDAIYSRPLRTVSLGNPVMPTAGVARFYGVPLSQLEARFWEAVNTPHALIETTALKVREALEPGGEVRIRTQSGTDLRFRLREGARVGMSDGQIHEAPSGRPAQVWLPAGEVYVAPDATTVNGMVVVPMAQYRGIKIRNLRLTFADGRLTHLDAAQNAQALREALDKSGGDKDVFAFLDIGVNPNSRPIRNADYYTYEMAGMVTIGIGQAQWADSPNQSEFAQDFHVPRATLEVDGKPIVRDGTLAI